MEISLKDKAQSRSARLLSGVALVALLAGWSIPAQAAADPETLAEIRALKSKLHQLEHRLDAQAQTQRHEKCESWRPLLRGAPALSCRAATADSGQTNSPIKA